MPATDIVIQGAREHNLRSVDVVLPRNQLICLTGVSGSGKSSLAFDTLYAEGQRRYVESLSTFARQFLGQMPKPEVDHISGLSPSISISQKSSGNNPRSTVGTITEIYDFLRVLFARVGRGHCPQCGKPITAQTREQIIGRIMTLPAKTQFAVLAPVIRGQKGEYRDLFEDLRKQGFVRARVDGNVVMLSDDLALDRQMRHNIEVVVDRLTAGPSIRSRLAESVDVALGVGKGSIVVAIGEAAEDVEARAGSSPTPSVDLTNGGEDAPARKGRNPKSAIRNPHDIVLSAHFACTDCGISFEEPSPQLFSFNSPQGMCLECDGLGEFFSFDPERLVSAPEKSFSQGAIELVGAWKDLGRWRRHIYRGVAETMERKLELAEGTLLETAWRDLPEELRNLWLWGTGEEHITFTWRAGKASQKYGGTYGGIIPELLEKYRTSKSAMQIKQLEKYMSIIRCPDCQGQRLNPQARAVKITTRSARFADTLQRTLPEVCALAVSDAAEFFADLELEGNQALIASEVLKEVRGRLGFLRNVGLDYLTLDRTAPTLSGGESQRIRLAGQVGCGLVGVLYILDEPSIGLHPRDNDQLLATLKNLRDLGNTVVVVEHDEDTMRAADHLIDFGPGPGVRGGEVVAIGDAAKIAKETRSVTGAFLSGKRKIEVPTQRRLRIADCGLRNGDRQSEIRNPKSEIAKLRILGARHNNLKNIDVEIPLGAFVCVTGVSGSGKSSLVNDILAEALLTQLMNGKGQPGEHDRIEGVQALDKLIVIDQSPIGRTPRSNPGTYIKLFDDIRNLYTQLPESKRRGYKPGRFSFNVAGGRCEACEGNGSNRLEMDFLADVWVTCPVCNGHRFNRETLQVMYREKNIAQVLEMDVQQALAHFEHIPSIQHKLSTLHAVGLDYIKIGQPSPTLSGGEAQRVKLARELVKKSTGRTLYLLDEPTTGLHFADIELLLAALHGFVDAGNTVLVVEHNLDVIKTADWVIDIGPEGGAGGGQIVACGTPEDVAQVKQSHTGRALAPVLSTRPAKGIRPSAPGPAGGSKRNGKVAKEATHIVVEGARQHNLRDLSLKIPRDQTTVFCGPSGSGKTSLAMDTIYAEGQRRYVESLSSYARQFVGQMQKPQVDRIEGLSPAIAIEQRNMGQTPRSTVGTVTEIYDYFRILFARLGQPYCPECDIPIGTQTSDQIVDKLLEEPEGTKLYVMAPVEVQVGEQYETLWDSLRGGGYVRVRIDGETHSLDELPAIDRRRKHAVEVVVDRIVVRRDQRSRIADSIENALALGKGVVHIAHPHDDVPEPRWLVRVHSQHLACEKCGRSFDTLNPHNFSFNSALGWCPACEGLGTQIGANPAALLRGPQLTLAQGALWVWPDVNLAMSQQMLAAFSAHTGVPADVPYEQLSPRQKRIVLYGTGEEWISVFRIADVGLRNKKSDNPQSAIHNPQSAPLFKFQFKGLYPALEEASKLSPRLRGVLEQFIDEIDCSQCGGSRLRDDAAAVRFRERTLDSVCRTPLGNLVQQVNTWKLSASEKKVAGELLREIQNRLTFLVDVGLEYLTLGRAAPTLSGGEAQRIRLASQVGSGLCGVLYVLDEPTIGLHPRDNQRLIAALAKLRDLGNTLVIVEHDREVLESADDIFDFGPGAGRLGGQIVASGSPTQIAKQRASVTGPYLSGKKAIGVPKNRRSRIADCGLRIGKGKKSKQSEIRNPKSEILCLEILGARHHNLKNISVRIPLGTLTAVTGVSGSGKSSLVEDILFAQLAKTLHRASTNPGAHDAIRGIEQINKVIRVDQQPLGNTPTSNPATYTGVFDLIRQLFSQLPESKLRGYTARRFSFNVPGGRCEACEGNGQQCIQMHFLPDVWVECDTCRGQRYNPDTLSVKFHGRSIAEVLDMSCGQAVELFANIPKIRRILQTLCDVGLDYLTLGQSAPTLSGGEAQRVKLAAELARPDTGQTLYLLDEPTTGLHFDDLAKLLDVLNRLVDQGNTVVVIEHNLDVIKTADWIIDLGPEAGADGGYIVAEGMPEEVVEKLRIADSGLRIGKGKKSKQSEIRNPKSEFVSHTARALAPVLAAGPFVERKKFDPAKVEVPRDEDQDIDEVGRDTKMPWELDGRGWHTRDRVDRNGRPCQWDGRILDAIEQRIQELGEFSPTNWSNRTVVEISAAKKADGWFFHAITGERWLVKLKFRTAKRTFERDTLIAELNFKPLNDIDEIEAYGRGPRVKCKNLRGPWQEVQIDAHSWAEVDTPEFWSFVERAVAGFNKFTERAVQKPADVMPWTVLGQKWHLSKKGFPPGKQTAWKPEVLEELLEMLHDAEPKGQFLWNNQERVYFMAPGIREPWAVVCTKRLAGVDLILNGPKGAFQLGGVAELGADRALSTKDSDRDQVKLRFVNTGELHDGKLAAFLKVHLDAFRGAGVAS